MSYSPSEITETIYIGDYGENEEAAQEMANSFIEATPVIRKGSEYIVVSCDYSCSRHAIITQTSILRKIP